MKFTYNYITKSYRSEPDCGISYDVVIDCHVIGRFLDITANVSIIKDGVIDYIGMYDVHIHDISIMRNGEIKPIKISNKHKVVTCKIVQDNI